MLVMKPLSMVRSECVVRAFFRRIKSNKLKVALPLLRRNLYTLETLRRSENVPDSRIRIPESNSKTHSKSIIFFGNEQPKFCLLKIKAKSSLLLSTELITQVTDAVVDAVAQVSAIKYIISNVYALRIYDSKQKLTERKSLIFQN